MYLFIKRIIDIILALIALTLFSPVFLVIMILLRFTGEGEIIYRQKRIGYKNQPFNILKFATMLKNSPQIGTGSITLRNDARVLPIGKFLRITKLNEIPQVINVLIGDMSIVGPRPLTRETFDYYPENIKSQVYRSKPGITGIGSVIFRDEEKLISASSLEPKEFYKSVIAPYKGQLEIWYNNNKSILLDLKLIFLTAWTIIFPGSNLHSKIIKGVPPMDSSLA